MRICYIASAESTHTRKWVNYFAKKGHEIHLISITVGEGYAGNVQLYLLNRLAPQIGVISGYLSAITWLFQARRLVRRLKPDILDAHFITTSGFLAVASGFHPLVLTAWGSDILLHPKQNIVYRVFTKYALRKADVIICDSETVKAGIVRLGINSAKIRKIFNGVDTQKFNPQRRDDNLKSKLGVTGTPMIICIRNLRPLYNVEMLIRAIPLVLDKVPEAMFIIGGEGEQSDYLERLASSLGTTSAIRFVGWIPHDELPKYLASSDVYLSTSLTDSTSLSLQEAMACELSPVVTDLPANREWVTDGENGFIVPLNDVSALASRIIYLLQNKGVRETFGKAGRKIIVERAEYKKEMEKVEELYQKLVKEVKCSSF